MSIQTIGIIGAGTMGNGIAQVLALQGITTRLYDVAPGPIERGIATIRTNLEKGVAKGKVAQGDADAALKRLTGTQDLDEAIRGVQCVIEAVPEKLELKQTLFQKLGAATVADIVRLRTHAKTRPKRRKDAPHA